MDSSVLIAHAKYKRPPSSCDKGLCVCQNRLSMLPLPLENTEFPRNVRKLIKLCIIQLSPHHSLCYPSPKTKPEGLAALA